ncbi:hypothetical protein Tco_0696559, partial [Tanacetum coccineum]
MRLEHELRGRKKFKGKYAMQANWLKEGDVEIASLKAQLSLKEVEAAEAIHLRGQVAVVEAAKAARASELNCLKERNAVLEGQVVALESAAVSKDAKLASPNAQVAKVTQDLSNLQLSCDELSVKASSLEFEKDKLVDQDEQVKALGDHVTGIDSDLMEMALHMDEEFYPCYLTTIAGRRWILSRGLKLAIMKCLQSPKYLTALGGVISRAMTRVCKTGWRLVLTMERPEEVLLTFSLTILSQKPIMLLSSMLSVPWIFPFLAQLESRKDASMADTMDLLHLEGHAAETPEASQLQPSPEQLMVPICRIRGDVAACRLSLTDAMVPLIEPLFVKSLTGEASTSGVPAMATTILLYQPLLFKPAPSLRHHLLKFLLLQRLCLSRRSWILRRSILQLRRLVFFV